MLRGARRFRGPSGASSTHTVLPTHGTCLLDAIARRLKSRLGDPVVGAPTHGGVVRKFPIEDRPPNDQQLRRDMLRPRWSLTMPFAHARRAIAETPHRAYCSVRNASNCRPAAHKSTPRANCRFVARRCTMRPVGFGPYQLRPREIWTGNLTTRLAYSPTGPRAQPCPDECQVMTFGGSDGPCRSVGRWSVGEGCFFRPP